MFFDRVIRTHFTLLVPFSRGRVPIYLSRIIFPGIVVTTAGSAEKYRFSFDAIHAPPPSNIRRFISAYSSFIENGFAGLSFHASSSSYTEYTTHVTRNFRALDRRSGRTILPVGLYDPRGESICRSCTGKYHLALVFRYSILFTIKSARRHRLVGAHVWCARVGVRHGLVFDGCERERESGVFAAIKRAYLIKPGPELMGQQPLSPLWNARIYQRAEVARNAKDFPFPHCHCGFSAASTEDPRYSNPPPPSTTKRVDKFDRVKMHSESSVFQLCLSTGRASRRCVCARNSRSKLRVAVNDE